MASQISAEKTNIQHTVLEKLGNYLENNNFGSIPHSIYQDKFQVDQRCKTNPVSAGTKHGEIT